MILGLGVDIAEVLRVRGAIERHGERFLNRVFTPAEVAYCRSRRNSYERFAARFAAKEATMKALGTGLRRGVTWRNMEVSNAKGGKPTMKLSGRARELFQGMGGASIALSITHTRTLALAEVIIEGKSPAAGVSKD